MSRSRRAKTRRVNAPNSNHPFEANLQDYAADPTEHARDCGGVRYAVPPELVKGVAVIATTVWKARFRTIDPASGEVREDMRRISADVERIHRCLNDLGVVVEDHTNKPFDYGLPWQVVATKPTPGITKEIVTETLKPTVRWNEQIIQHAEVEIGTPA